VRRGSEDRGSVELTNAERVVFPEAGLTKGDVFAYYESVADAILPYLAGRALTVERFPKGLADQGFMQKNVPEHYPDYIGRHSTPKQEGGTTVYPVVDGPEAISFFANQGVITFHVPPVLVHDLDHPDWVIWDLDPSNRDMASVRRAAHSMREVLEAHGVPTLPMTSGSRGYHLRARLRPTADAETVAEMARGVAVLAAAAHPDLLTVEFRKKNRGSRVFVDWLRNAPYATAVAPWSLRARPNAPVATPLTWEYVDSVDPDGITMADGIERSRHDPWEAAEPLDPADCISSVATALDEAGIELPPFDRFRS
jgi:bifunctional non-homologous end joining protein LigD